MRIIQRGVSPDELEYRGTCNHCKTVFGFYKADVKEHYDQREGSWIDCKCPHCKRQCFVNYNNPIIKSTIDPY